MLAQTVDTKLWDAQRVLQSVSTNAVKLSGCDALSGHWTPPVARCRRQMAAEEMQGLCW